MPILLFILVIDKASTSQEYAENHYSNTRSKRDTLTFVLKYKVSVLDNNVGAEGNWLREFLDYKVS